MPQGGDQRRRGLTATTQSDGLHWGTPAARWVLAASVLGSGVASLDATVVGIAVPHIGRSFHVGVSSIQWVATGYTLTLAGLLLLGGSLGDRYGRKKCFTIGVAWFAVASALCGIAPSASALIAARILQGIGGALLTPGSLAILQASFVAEDRARAIGAWSGLGGVAAAAGPFVGGELISLASWRWVFYINLPVAAAVLWISARHVPETRDPSATGRPDLTGAALILVALAALTYGLIEGPVLGWSSPAIAVSLALGALSVVAVILVEGHRRHPMLPLGIFRGRQLSAANGVTFVIYGALTAALFLLPTELQVGRHYSPTAAGIALLPVTAIMLVLSARSGRLAARIGPRLQMSVGPVIVGTGLVLLTRAPVVAGYVEGVLPGVVILGLGLAVTVAPLTATALAAAPAEHAGLASAVNNDVARIAGLIAVAVLPPLAGIAGGAYLNPHLLGHGFRVAVVVAACLCAIAGVLAAVTIRNPDDGALPADRRAPIGRQPLSCAVDAPPAVCATSEAHVP
ncbi:MAG: MFS transporter [Actinomycetota bacterium]|nr:MFS transporter [Actinomycetota bacterium]